jgi:hypothetical protein
MADRALGASTSERRASGSAAGVQSISRGESRRTRSLIVRVAMARDDARRRGESALQAHDVEALAAVERVSSGDAVGNCSGRTPMPIRFDRWMRSNDSAITAHPSNCGLRGPIAATIRHRSPFRR